jgi:ribosomal protein L32
MNNDSSTAIALYSDTRILTDLVTKQKEVAVCDHCGESLIGKDSFVICRAPDVVEVPGNNRHLAHTACFECADNLSYIGDAGACAPCLQKFGSRRSMAKFAGVALRPMVVTK